MAVSDTPWGNFSESGYTPESYCSAALIDENPTGAPKTKSACHLPVKEPSGSLNRNGVHAAAQRLTATGVSADSKRKAAVALMGYYGQLGEDAPDTVKSLAGRQVDANIRKAAGS